MRASVSFWKRMSISEAANTETQLSQEETKNKETTKIKKRNEFLSTHPSHENRSNYLETLMPNV